LGVRLDVLRTMVLERADMVSSSFVSTSELNRYINQSGAELHGVLVTRFEDYLTSPTPTSFELTGSASTYALPTDFMKLRGVDYYLNGDWEPVRSFAFEERGRWSRSSLSTLVDSGRRYRVMGGYLTFQPDDGCSGTYRYWYVPRWSDLSSDSSELPAAFTGWHEFIVVDSAIKCLMKEESDVSALMTQRKALLDRIEAEATNRDVGEQEVIADVYDRNDW
jgi:hypothetical protein